MAVGANISIVTLQPNQPPFHMVSIPVIMLDADRTEALGLPIATLILALVPPVLAVFVGDSQYIVNLLSSNRSSGDLFMFYRVELTKDLMGNCEF